MIYYGHGVHLMPLTPENSELYRTARNDFSTWRWCRQNDLISPLQQKRWIEEQDVDKTIAMYEIHDTGSGDIVGVCGFTDLCYFNQRAEFSLYVLPGRRGKNYGEKGLRTLLEHGFKNFNLNMIWGETFQDNPAAAIFERIGMVKTGYRPKFYFKDGKFIDAYFYCILRENFLEVQ